MKYVLNVLVFLLVFSTLCAQTGKNSVGLKFMGLSIHPEGGLGNEALMPNKLDKNAYFVMNLGAIFSYERFVFKDVVSIKLLQGLYADCAARFAGFTGIGVRGRIFRIGKHRLYGGLGPVLLYRRNWFDLPGFKDTKYFSGRPGDTWQYKFLWYGGEFEYRYAINERFDVAATFVPGYPDLLCLSVGLSYNF